MFGTHKWLWDLTGGAGLALALLLVVLLNRPTAAPEHISNSLEVRLLSEDAPRPQPKRLRLAVTDKEWDTFSNKLVGWDDMGRLLDEMGEGYQHDVITTQTILQNPALLEQYDVLFLTCAPRGGAELKDALFGYVSRGGTLYASDWRFDAVAAAFPEYVDRRALGQGTEQHVQAEVVDPSLRELVGPDISLRFDLPSWKTAAFAGPRVTTLLQGRYRRQRQPYDRTGVPDFAPLLVKMTAGKGTVIFTSFHNEKQNSELEKKLLQYLVFRLVTAEVEAEVAATISSGGFTPQASNLLSTPQGNPTVTRTYKHESGRPLRFALGFRPEGATLRLTITSPDGRSYQWEGQSTVLLEVPQAASGEWTYTITAVHLPYPHFPFTVTVGEKK